MPDLQPARQLACRERCWMDSSPNPSPFRDHQSIHESTNRQNPSFSLSLRSGRPHAAAHPAAFISLIRNSNSHLSRPLPQSQLSPAQPAHASGAWQSALARLRSRSRGGIGRRDWELFAETGRMKCWSCDSALSLDFPPVDRLGIGRKRADGTWFPLDYLFTLASLLSAERGRCAWSVLREDSLPCFLVLLAVGFGRAKLRPAIGVGGTCFPTAVGGRESLLVGADAATAVAFGQMSAAGGWRV